MAVDRTSVSGTVRKAVHERCFSETPLSKYDLIIVGVPFVFVLVGGVGVALSASLRTVLVAWSVVSMALILDGVLRDPPVTNESKGRRRDRGRSVKRAD
ncbi:MAG: hypothetical protein SV760_06750 [Halobacteria archaeon]|nr:hypothetical protein [Halobacteria archaeon]